MAAITQVVAVVSLITANLAAYLQNDNSILKARRFSTHFVTNRAAGFTQADRPQTFFAWEQLDAHHLVTTFLGPCGTVLLLLYRICGVLYFTLVILLVRYESQTLHDWFLPYFTNWTCIALGLYALIGTILSTRHLLQVRRSGERAVDSEPRPYGKLDKLFTVVLTMSAASGAFLTAFFWLSIHRRGTSIDADSAMRHGGNVCFFAGEYLLSRTPVDSSWIVFPLAYASIYAVFLWIFSSLHDEWVYEALNWNDSSAWTTYILLPVGVYIGFLLMYLIAWLREYLWRGKRCCQCFRPTCAEGGVEGSESASDPPTEHQDASSVAEVPVSVTVEARNSTSS